ncbi:MAG TPA: DUF1569 domain-containing protein [Chitinophagales bacterium]|nr:DUF1569 domain-containing protein [Chitinophagales bacterium]HRG84327.1 DUF1569 domain-containing protein [Chitinophagales bacterium]
MASIFNAEDTAAIISRIEKLTPITQHIWGTMTVSQMLAHIQEPVKVALGYTAPKRSVIGWLFGRAAKKGIINEKPFKQGLPTDSSFVIDNERNFDTEKQEAIELLRALQKAGPNGITKNKHPFFGKLSAEEWDTLTIKHLDHHLRQFGV